jgi:hypothetical protein
VELGVCLVGAGALTVSKAPEVKRRNQQLATSLELTATCVDSALHRIYVIGIFVASAGLLGVGCFLGGALGALA